MTVMSGVSRDRQPLTGDDVQELLAHVNEGHVPELLHCVQVFTPVQGATHAQMTALFPGGMELEVTSSAGIARYFVPFSVTAPSHDAVRATVRDAMRQLNLTPEGHVAHWAVMENRVLTPHFRRLTVEVGHEDGLDWTPGYACRFDIPGHEHGRPYTLRRVDPQRLPSVPP